MRPPTRTTPFALATAALATTLLAVGVTPAQAVDDTPPMPFCPPVSQSVGTHVQEKLYDPDAHPGHYVPSVAAGALPGGATLVDGQWFAEYQSPTPAVGSYDFTLRLTSDFGSFLDKTCHVDVVADLALTGVTTVDRIGGSDRYDVAAAISKTSVPGTRTLYVASGVDFPDALSASPVVAHNESRLLLTKPDELPESIFDEIHRVDPLTIVVLGGTSAVSTAVETRLKTLGALVVRIEGSDRYELSRNLIADSRFGAAASSKAYLATGRSFPDALSAASAAAHVGAPVLLADGQAPSLSSVETDLFTTRGVTRTMISGGPTAVSTGIEDSVRLSVTQVKRPTGGDRYATSAAVARDAFSVNSTSLPTTAYVATGQAFPDALTGTVLAAENGSPLYLVRKDCIPRDAAQHMADLKISKVVILGGPAAVSDDVAALTVCSE
ncbi:cell wall-binding repeat-containing protein [Herbiconiux sp. VKM Ac-1786]|uniref:cell wall-binding repeat-containing protein n=1 Tax=Herbiconiux sp. VKM Ac-1786 TaxID=2783824 RepID=UPI00188AC0E3|nr:cell wall-binding repeat-containing protein [Herbiconiux sp. VKM Ac-1786]MBF4573670.1 cell wall-binding repeat-containing protein [Herbiconiux sp. VKM Ac-1786]